MKCTAFRERALETGRTLLDSKTDEAQAHADHAKTCPSCADWVGAQRRLTESLTLIARHHADQSASPRIEAALVAAFRRRSLEVQPTAAPQGSSRWLWFGLPAVLAAAAAAVTLASLAYRPQAPPTDPRNARLVAPSASPTVTPVETTSTRRVPSDSPKAPETRKAARPSKPTGQPSTAAPSVPRPAPTEASVAEATQLASSGSDVEPTVAVDLGFEPPDFVSFPPLIAAADAQESPVDAPFVPLGPADTPAFIEGGQVIRVELSPERARSAGLPVDPNAGRASIRADVVVGHDGVARAIRVIKER